MSSQDALSPAEEAVLAVYRTRRIRPGYGLTATTFRKELKYIPLPAITEAIASLLAKGCVGAHPVIQDFYLLTPKGDEHLRGGGPGSSGVPEAGAPATLPWSAPGREAGKDHER